MDENVIEKRVSKPTLKAMEENVRKQVGSRKAKLSTYREKERNASING